LKKEALEDTTHLPTMTEEALRLDGIIELNKKNEEITRINKKICQLSANEIFVSINSYVGINS